MTPAVAPRPDPLRERLLVLDPDANAWADARVRDLGAYLRAGDLLVLNDAATLPASLSAQVKNTPGVSFTVEVRLVSRRMNGHWRAVLLGDGDWRTPTEKRPAPPSVAPGDALEMSGVSARVVSVSDLSPRLVEIEFDAHGDALWSAIYRAGRPVQYAYLRDALELWDVQTPYASRPWAVEAPSAGRPLRWSLLAELKARGVAIATLTHAAGLSSTGDSKIDAALPFAEAYEIPRATIDAISRASRVIAVGTTVVRALESYAATGVAAGETELRLGPDSVLRIVDGLVTGLHEPHASHFELLQAFAARPLLERAYAHADAYGYLWHELGDSNLILHGSLP